MDPAGHGSAVRRPKPGEDEDDLLRQMHNFKSEQSSISKENVVRMGEKRKSDEAGEPDEEAVRAGSVMSRNIVERNIAAVVEGEMLRPKRNPAGEEIAFPKVFNAREGAKLDDGEGVGGKKRSLFAQRMAFKSGANSSTAASPEGKQMRKHPSDWGKDSRILQGSGLKNLSEVGDIHRENVERLSVMTEEEIQAAREEIVSAMSLEAVEFIRKRSAKLESTPHSRTESFKTAEPMETDAVSSNVSEEVIGTPYVPPVTSTFVNMDKIEEEKMEWTKDLPPAPEGKCVDGKYAARFDFEGALVPADADIPVTAGLHHHGEEPSRAGYTLEELLILARSTNIQQKAFAINTCSRIVQKHKKGYFDDGVLDQNVIDRLRESGFVLILRSSLDDTTEILRESALVCLRQMIDNQYDELVLDREYAACFGHIQPSLPTEIVKDLEKREEFRSNREALKDFEVMKLDFVKGLLQMDILQRLAYVLQKLQPTPSATKNALCTLRRMARHSLQAASEIARHPTLLDIVFERLSDPSADPTVQTETMKLARVVSGWGKTLAQTVLSKLDFAAVISRNMAMETGIVALTLESLRLWDTCLRYGLLVDLFSTLFPLIMKYFVAVRAQVAEAGENIVVNYDVAALLFKATEAFLATEAERSTKMTNLLEVVQVCIAAMSRDTFDKSDPRVSGFLDSCVNLLNTFLLLLSKDEEVSKTTQRATKVLEQTALPLCKSDYCRGLLEKCSKYSAILSTTKDGRARDPENLPSVGVVAERGAIVPTVDDSSPFRLLRSVFNCLYTLTNLNKSLARSHGESLKRAIFENKGLKNYMGLVAKGGTETMVSNWFTTDEHIFIFYFLLLDQSASSAEDRFATTWNLSNRLLRRIHFKQETFARILFDRVVCNFDYLVAEDRMKRMGIEECADGEEAAKSVFASLDEIKSLYKGYIPKGHDNWPFSHGKPSQTETLTQRNAGEQLLPSDWSFLPLLLLCNNGQATADADNLGEDETRRVILCLRWIYLSLLQQRGERLSSFDLSVQYSRVLTVFIASSSLFLEAEVKKFVRLVIDRLFDVARMPSFDRGGRSVPGIDDMADFYRQVVAQYASVSYGDDLFSLAILLPTAGKNGQFKDILWVDNQESFRAFQLKPDQLPAAFGVSSFTDSVEDATADRMRAYAGAIASNRVDAKRNPLLFQIAQANLVWAWDGGNAELSGAIAPFREQLEKFGL